MKTTDEEFYSEFVQMMSGRRAYFGNAKAFRTMELPMPELNTMMSGGTLARGKALINGIREPYFRDLNKTEVDLLPRAVLKKRQFLSNGEIRRDAEGNIVYTQVPVPQGSVGVVSTKNIKLKPFIEVNGIKRAYNMAQGFKYVDYIDKDGKRYFVYIVPKKYVYEENLCALIMTPNTHRAFYKGYSLALQNGNTMYFYVVNYRNNSNANYRVLGIKPSTDFNSELASIIKLWVSMGLAFNPNATALKEPVKGIMNLGLRSFNGTYSEDDYHRVTKSLADKAQEDTYDV